MKDRRKIRLSCGITLIEILVMIAILAIVVSLVGPSVMRKLEQPSPDEKIEGVVRIWMHDGNYFRAMVQDSQTNVMTMRRIQDISKTELDAKFIPDVSQGKKLWILIKYRRLSEIASVEFHIRSVEDIEGTGFAVWRFGQQKAEIE